MHNEKIIAYDFGTSGVKAVLIDTKARVIETAMSNYDMFTPKPGWAEQVPDDYWQAVIFSTRELLHKSNVVKESIKAIVFATQAMGIIPLDNKGRVLYNNISWVDGRAEKQANKINKIIKEPKFGAKSVVPKLMWIKEKMPEMYDKTKYFVDVNAYLRYKATGKITAELTGACSYGINLDNNSWDKKLFDAAGIDVNKLPPLCHSIDKIGKLTEAAANDLMLTADAVVMAGCNDVEAAAVGAVSVGNNEGHIYLGSSAWICGIVERNFKTKNGATISKSPNPSKNLIKGVTQSSGMTLDKAMHMLYMQEKHAPRINEYQVLESEIKDIGPGSDSLIITPWIYGETCPVTDDNVRSTFFNMNYSHTRAHIVKAIREGIGYNLRWMLENFENDYNLTFTKLNVVGGGGLSDNWIQSLSDILQIPLYTTENMRHAGAIGAAVCGMIGLKDIDDFSDLNSVIKIKKSFLPNIENKLIYDMFYKEYKNLYYDLKSGYERINGREERNKNGY